MSQAIRTNYQYQTTQEMRAINPEYVRVLTANRPTFNLFPIVNSNKWELIWRQKDNWRGFQQLRGLNGEPSYVKMVGEGMFSAKPGVWGEYMTLDEEEMTKRAEETPEGEPIDVQDLVAERNEYLAAREIDLIEYIHWQALLNGTYTFLGPLGAVYKDTFPIQTQTLSDWSVPSTATPIADLRALFAFTEGKSVVFNSQAGLWMNRKTANYLLANTNAADLGGFKVNNLNEIKTMEQINQILVANDLPQVNIYDLGYFRESDGAFQKWIPDDKVVLIGARTDGSALGEYRMVRNAVNPGREPGSYVKVIDRTEERVPPIIEVHRGHNGGLVIFYGSAIMRLNV